MRNWSNVEDHTIVKILDFSENYTCLLSHVIQSLNWIQDTTTVYLLLVLGKVNKYVHGDYMFLTNVPFIELCNSCLHEHYVGEGVSIIHDVEYNDGCASQFKCQNISCSCLAQRKSNANL